ncbi:MAG: phospholipase D-like domain-containing protein [Caldilineaceae bacterium]
MRIIQLPRRTLILWLWFAVLGIPLYLIIQAQPVAGKASFFAQAPITHFVALTTTPTSQIYLPWIAGPLPSHIIIAAAHIDSALSGEGDEAILLWNTGVGRQTLAGWSLYTRSRHATFPLTTTLTLEPGERLWCAAQAAAFQSTFGEMPACTWDDAGQSGGLALEGSLALANSGGHIQVRNAQGQIVDTLIYGAETQPATGWKGAAAQLYTRGDVPNAGQIWQRKLDPDTALPIDSDQATDWAGDLADLQWGRRVRMPGWQGWSAADLGLPSTGVETATVTAAVGPEGLYQPLADLLTSATSTIDLSLYTLEHQALAQIIADAAQRGIRVRLLLEGSPPGGISDLQKWSVATIVNSGGEVRYLAVTAAAPKGYRTRYRFLHAKYGVVDGIRAFNGTENLTEDAMPVPSAIPVGGRRGFYLFTDAATVVQALQRIFAQDWQPERFYDLQPFDPTHTKYGGPPADFVFPEAPLYPVTAAPFATPLTVRGAAHFAVLSAPENALRPDAGLLALLARTGAGDEILVMQLYEHKQWGESTSNPIADPNPRLQALIEAARRGAHIQVLLDSFFDEPEALRSNQATVVYLQELAAAEGLALEARVGNPTLGGIHAKLVLVRVGTEYWSAVGSLNGGEISHKLNREVVVLTDLAPIHARLAEVFHWDWAQSQ